MEDDPTLTGVLNEPEILTHRFDDDGAVPNNPRLPLIVYRQAVNLPDNDPAHVFEVLFARNGWGGSWRNGILPFNHFHSTAHEVLGIYSGSATVQLGGEGGVTVTLEPGDVAVLPAGTGHRKLRSSGSLGVVGAYPNGQRPDMCRAEKGIARVQVAQVAQVTLPGADPVYGPDGPLFEHWHD
ncbi:MAG: cupin domain-containing protein [Gammaproteobacteria bacterium]|nr:cupin domain-containing protein [Gammaproteobacteria bacterium]NIR83187.1 cupin domain-containing protein [Gammaproteobacteria bacterium]NIR90995.1 cupin domain-containing protein [Gammaproteobacteria bacterium]NIU04352.1 cupin domain-containing protein [Gammaproteobacteria bacterium]NIV52575.1 cupin domain-containing protein [Gammaproteobacteria bacterium]